MEERSYRINGTKARSILAASLGSLFGLFVLDMFIFEPIPNGTLLINMIIVVLLSAGIGVLVNFLHKDKFLKLCEGGIDHISGKNVTHYSFEDFLGGSLGITVCHTDLQVLNIQQFFHNISLP